jgi:hypothetical protein
MRTNGWIYIVVAALLALTIFGCSRFVDSDNPVRALPAPPPTPINVAARLNNSAVTLTWEVIDTTKALRFRVYTTDAIGQNSSLRDSTTSAEFTRTITGLLVNQTYYFSVSTVGAGGIEGERSTPYAITAGIISISINNGKLYTNTRDISITASVPQSATHIMLSENAGMTGASFEPISGSATFTLSDGDGLKHVYGRFIFSDGSQSGDPVSDSITLDTRARIDSVYFTPTSTLFTAHNTITFFLKSSEPNGTATVSFTGADAIPLYDDGVAPDVAAADGIYTGKYVVPSNLIVTAGLVTGSFTDAAGNQAPAISSYQTLTIYMAGPKPVVLAGTASDSTTVRLTWSQYTDDNFLLYRLYRSADTTVAVDTTTQLVTIIGSQGSTSYDDRFRQSESAVAYRIFVYDKQGKAAGSNKVVVKK